ncbi:ribonuclease E/G [Magnetovibrio sp.]|uniref:ribonuclease E/G n=1 Tax=Magnetovibrio sp. TaxID=2024836 RepID=UPI002F922274
MDSLIVRVRPGETRIARADADGRLKDFAIYREQNAGLVGDVFLGRIKKVIPAMEAAFVDIGAERDGFLALPEARPQPHMGGGEAPRDRISDYVHEGEAVLVQVLASARDSKGPKLTRRVNVTGAFLVLTPNDPGIRVSKRIRDDAERNRLRAVLTGLLNGREGCVVRSGAEGAGQKTLQGEIGLLRVRWADMLAHAEQQTPPALVSGDVPPAIQFLTENGHGGLSKIVVDDAPTAKKLEAELSKLEALPSGGVQRHPGSADVFESEGIADEVAGLMNAQVRLPGGGSLIIEETAAVTTIDVNVGGAGGGGGRAGDVALATNLDAMKETARQMRLRNLAGLIVIDIVSMTGKDGPGRVVTALKEALAQDPASPQVLGTTRGGLLEVTRPRRRPPLSTQLMAPCPVCGTGRAEAPLSVGYRALDRVLAEVWAQPSLIPALRLHPSIARALKDEGQAALDDMENKLGQPLELVPDDKLGHGQFRVEPAQR